jgi:hypothetical protein
VIGRHRPKCATVTAGQTLKPATPESVSYAQETVLSPSNNPVSQLWNHVTGEFRAWERAPRPPKHFEGMLPAEFSKEQHA